MHFHTFLVEPMAASELQIVIAFFDEPFADVTYFVLSYSTVIYWVILGLYLEVHLFDTLGFESFGRNRGLDNFHGRLDLGCGFGLLRIFFFTLGFSLAHSSVSLGRFDNSTILLLVAILLAAQIGRLGEDGTRLLQMLGFVVRLLHMLVVWHLIRCVAITAIILVAMMIFSRDWIISRQLLEVKFLTIGERLVPLLLKLALKVVTLDAGLVAVLADVVNVLEALLSHELLL